MRPRERLESAPAACVGMSIDMAAEQANAALPASMAEVAIGRLGHETGFDVPLYFAAAQQELTRGAMQASPVARTPGKPVRIRSAVIAAD